MSDTTWKCYTEGAYVVTSYNGGYTRVECFAKNEGKKNATTAEQQATKECAAKIAKRAKKAGKHFFKMKATKYDAKKSGRGTIQPKLDGIGCSAYWLDGKLILQSSGGDDLKVEHIRRQVSAFLPVGHEVDGEFYIHGVPLQTLNGLVKKDQPGSERLQFWIYDSSTGFDFWKVGIIPDGDIITTPTHYVTGDAEVQMWWKRFTSEGYEGVMFRPQGAEYEQCPGSKRSKSVQKVKKMQHAEFHVVGYKFGRGKNEKIPTFRLLLDPEGLDTADNTFTCNGAGNLAEQAAADADSFIGQMMTVQFFSRSIRGAPQLPTKGVIRPEGF